MHDWYDKNMHYNLLIYLLPHRAMMPSFGGFITYQLGGNILDTVRMRILLYGEILVFSLLFASRSFKRQQVVG